MGHIMAYHEWPLKPPSSIRESAEWFWSYHQFSGSYKSTFIDPFSNTTKSFSSITYDWKGMKSRSLWDYDRLITYTDDYLKNLMQIGVLFLAIGDKVDMKYNNDNLKGSGALQDDVRDGFEALGYHKPEKKDYSFARVKNSLRECKPVMMGGSRGDLFEASGHYWIIDGYRTSDVTMLSEPGVIKTNEEFVHCVPGWGDSGVGWYFSGVFELNAPVADSNARSSGKEGYYKHNLHIFTNLYPNNNKKVTINVVDGVPLPLTGFVPRPTKDTVINIVETPQFTGTVEWYVPTGSGELQVIAVNEAFADGIEYTAVITLTHKAGFTLHGVEADFFTVTGAVSASNPADSGLIAAVFPPAVNLFASGKGIESDPFIINTKEQLRNLNYFSAAHFQLGTDIDLQNIPWTPIPEFHGTLNGNNNSISNLNMTFTNGMQRFDYHTNSISYGLFAFNKGKIHKLKVKANIDLTNIPGNYSLQGDTEIVVGVISAKNNGTIHDCTVSASSGSPMINSTIHTGNVAGGITGYNYNIVTSCTNNGDIHSSLTTGGIIGCNTGVTSESTNNALIQYTYKNMINAIGGIVGVNILGDILGGANNGTIAYANSASTSQSIQPCMGHILGKNSSGTIASGSLNFNGVNFNPGTLQTVTYTSGGVTKTHNQALYAGNGVIGRGYIGDGIENNPYLIYTVGDLNDIQYHQKGTYFKLMNNIDLQNVPWTPIPEFHATLDGNGYTISNLNMTFTNGASGNYYHTDRISFGLIAFNKGAIRNLKVTANINLTNISGNYSLPGNTEIVVGVIAAGNDGTIQNCAVSSSNGNPMINSEIHTGNIVGGITGYNYGWVLSCTNGGEIHTSLTTGGVVGCNIGVTNGGINNASIRYTYKNSENAIGGVVGVNLMGLIDGGTNSKTIAYANSASTSQLIQPCIGHIAGSKTSDSVVKGTLNFSGGTVNIGTLQTVTYTSGGVSQTHNQALYAGNRALGRGYIGLGTSSEPFLVITAENLKNIIYSVNGNHFKLMNNIDLQNIPWTPLEYFNGNFDGNTYTISNLNMKFENSLLVNNKTISYGLFAENKGTIRNLKVTASINLTNIPSNYTLPQNREIFAGVIAAGNYGTIQNCTVSSSSSPMINSTIHVRNTTGGVAGENYSGGNITTCTNNGAVYSNGGTGGIIGHNRGSSSGCTNTAQIRYTWVSENRGAGGIAGENTSGSITSGTNNGSITYANTNTSTNVSVQPYMAHIVGHSNVAVNGTFTFGSNSAVNPGTLQNVTYTSGGVTQTHNQAFFVGSRVAGRVTISGSGTASSPYLLTSESHMIYLRQFPNANFRLSNNIDMSSLGAWTPVTEFTGTLNGNNYTISNLKMTFTNCVQRTVNYRDCISFGLFVHNKGMIQNLQVTANIDLTNVASNYSLPQDREIVVGVVAAVNEGKIQNTKVSTSSGSFMINSTIHVRTLTGGIAGYNDNNGSITSCTNNGTIFSSGTTGGIMGCNIGDTSSCINNGTIRYTYTNHNSSIGGIAGGSLMGFILSGTNNGTIVYANASSTSQLIQPAMGHIAGATSSAHIPINSVSFSSGTVNIGTLQTVGSHNQALYAGNRVLGRGYIFNGNAMIWVP